MSATSEILVFDKELMEEKQWWVQKLSQDIGKSSLAPDYDRTHQASADYSAFDVELSEQLCKKLSKTTNNSPFLLYAVLMAGLKACLYRFTGSKKIVVGSRALKEAARINVLAIVDELDDSLSFRQLLMNVRQSLLDAYARQNYPFARLVEDLGFQRSDFGNPLFDVALSLRSIHGELPPSGCDINITFEKGVGESVSGVVEYKAALFKQDTIERFIKCYANLLDNALENVQGKIYEIPILDETDRNQILFAWNDTRLETQAEPCIHRLFEERVSSAPDAVAVEFGDKHVSCRELNQRANQLAHYLRKLGVGPETVVGLFIEPSLEMIIGVLGILKAGGAFLPLDADYPPERILFMVDNSQAPVLLTLQRLIAKLPNNSAKVVAVDTEWEAISAESKENVASRVASDNLAYLIYTSGSTGSPKAALLQHRGACNLAKAQAKVFGLSSGDRIMQFASLSFDASVWEILMALLGGGKLCLGSKEALMPGPAFVEMLRDHDITHITLPPSVLSALPSRELNFLTTIIVAGEACPAELVRDWAGGRRFFNAYGPTETTVCATVCECSDTGRTPSIGRPIANSQVYLLDEHLQPVPVGVVGEIYIGGLGLTRGYLRKFGQTAQKLVPDPFSSTPGARLFKTGDLARFLPDGNIEYVNRIDHQVKIHGYRIELGEIEAAIRRCTDVREAVVTARDDLPGGKRLVAYVVPHAERQLTPDMLRSHLRETLPEFMLPSSFMLMESFPLTPAGKVDRKALPAPTRDESEDKSIAPRDAVELQLVQICEDILSTQPIGVRNDFFESGGNSILAAVLIGQIKKAFGVKIPVALLFQEPTIERLGIIVRQRSESTRQSSLVAIQPKGLRRPFFCVHPAGGNVICYVELARQLGTGQPFFGLQAQGLDAEARHHKTIEEMAAHYVDLLRSVQLEGPYFLGGWSMGGIVAYEMAVQLEREGQEVGLLALFDTPAPIPPASDQPEQEMDDAALLVAILSNILGDDHQLSEDYLRQLGPDEQLLCVMEMARKANRAIPDLDLGQAQRLLHIFKNNSNIARAYTPQPYYGRLTVFKAVERDGGDTYLGWETVAKGGIDIQIVPGRHQNMIFHPHVQTLAERLRTCLDGAEAGSSKRDYLEHAHLSM